MKRGAPEVLVLRLIAEEFDQPESDLFILGREDGQNVSGRMDTI
jgi:hypothetical protein